MLWSKQGSSEGGRKAKFAMSGGACLLLDHKTPKHLNDCEPLAKSIHTGFSLIVYVSVSLGRGLEASGSLKFPMISNCLTCAGDQAWVLCMCFQLLSHLSTLEIRLFQKQGWIWKNLQNKALRYCVSGNFSEFGDEDQNFSFLFSFSFSLKS